MTEWFTLLASDNQKRNSILYHVVYIFIISLRNYCSAPINENTSMILISLNVPWKSTNPLIRYERWILVTTSTCQIHHILNKKKHKKTKNTLFVLPIISSNENYRCCHKHNIITDTINSSKKQLLFPYI